MTKRRRRRDPLHSPDDSLHVPADRIPQSPVPLPRPVQAYADDVARFWHARLEQGAGNFATAISAILALPQLRAFWPMSSVDEAENVYDISGQGRALSPQTNPSFGTEGLTPYLLLNGSHYMERTDEAGLDITGSLTLGGWFYHDALGSDEGLISKYNASGGERAYLLYKTASNDRLRFVISDDGNNTTGRSSVGSIEAATWYFGAARFTPSSEIAVWLNTDKDVSTITTSSINNSAANLQLGAFSAGSNRLDGRIALPFICAHPLTDRTIAQLYHATRILFAL